MFINSIRNGINSFNPRKKLSGKALAGKNVKNLRSKEHAQLTHDHGTKRHSQDSSPGRQFPLTTVSLWGSTSWKDLDISYNRLQSTCFLHRSPHLFPPALGLSFSWVASLHLNSQGLDELADEDGCSCEDPGCQAGAGVRIRQGEWVWPGGEGREAGRGCRPGAGGSSGWRFWHSWMAGVRERNQQVAELKKWDLRT